jgi:hypothetical protein
MGYIFNYATSQDSQIANTWNSSANPYISPSEENLISSEDTNQIQIDQKNPYFFIAFFYVTFMPDETLGNEELNWLKKQQDEPISILLVHYDPLRDIRNSLLDNSVPCRDFEQFRDPSSALSQQYQGQIVTFASEMQAQGNRFEQNLLDKVDKADMIVSCWGEFMESPYREKHIYQGKSRGKIIVYENTEYFHCHATLSY